MLWAAQLRPFFSPLFKKMGLSWPLFGFIFPFSWYNISLQLIIYTMVNDDTGKKKKEYASFYEMLEEKARHPVRID